jgi:hypothetical protein
MSCYNFKELHYKNPIFNNVEATYIIHLEGNGRLIHIQSQLHKFHPTETVYIMFNQGYKKCEKDEYINKPPLDLVDAFYTVFKDAEKKGYENILVLEDDFMFDDEILDKKHPAEIDRFLMKKKGQHFIYYVGTLPFLQLSTFGFHNRVFASIGTHSCIYPKKYIKDLVYNIPQNIVTDWDLHTAIRSRQYKYYKTLCYQTFPQTENQKNWGGNTFLHFILENTNIRFIRLLHLDTTPQPGYNICEIGSICITWIILFIIIVMNTRLLVSMILNNKLINNKLGFARIVKQMKRL